jgi:hypothetical protein
MSLEFDRPVGVIEELLPASIASVAEVYVQQGVAFGLDGPCYQCHVGLFGRPSAFACVASDTCADDILPCCQASQ